MHAAFIFPQFEPFARRMLGIKGARHSQRLAVAGGLKLAARGDASVRSQEITSVLKHGVDPLNVQNTPQITGAR